MDARAPIIWRWARLSTLSGDQRGAELVEVLIVAAVVGLGAAAAARGLTNGVRDSATTLGEKIRTLQPTAVASVERPVPSPRPGPAPTPPAQPAPRAPELTNDRSPAIEWLHMGTDQGGALIMKDTRAQSFLEQKRQGRVDALARAGQHHDTRIYGPSDALAQVADMTPQILDASRRYGLDRALLSGVLASEIDFDTDGKDIAQNIASRIGIQGGQGPGAANVHLGDLEQAKAYLVQHHLPGAEDAAKFDASFGNVYDHPVEAAAIVVAWKADLKRQAGGTLDSPEDMAVIFGAYRAGESNFDLKNDRIRDGADELVQGTGDANAALGSNAYQAEPYFDYYIEYYRGVDAAYGHAQSEVL